MQLDFSSDSEIIFTDFTVYEFIPTFHEVGKIIGKPSNYLCSIKLFNHKKTIQK